jgi:NaMN:DMB phosphoribosyltransferase
MADLFTDVTKLIDRSNARQLFLATATGNATGNLEEITRDGQTVADTQRYPTLSSVPALVVGNRLLVWSDGVQCVILGRIDS